ncbi:MAG: Amuc_1100 family pilus-like protein [Kiritimatiellia bacterium]
MEKKNIIVLSVVVAVGVLLVFATVLLLKGIHELSEATEELDRSKKEYRAFYSMAPFPSRENVARVQENVKTLNHWYALLDKAVKEGQTVTGDFDRSPNQFLGRLEETRNRLFRSYEGEPFDFGFSHYIETGVPPPPEKVPKLTQQLVIIEDLCEVLFENEVGNIQSVTRLEFEGTASSTFSPSSRSSRSSRRRPRGRPSVGTPATGSRGAEPQEEDYETLRFGLEFTAMEYKVWKVMNLLARHDLFIVVKAVRLGKTEPGVRNFPEARGERSGLPDSWKYKEQRLVSGPEIQVPLKVKIVLDIYVFPAA